MKVLTIIYISKSSMEQKPVLEHGNLMLHEQVVNVSKDL